jgi:Kae1-associated kinase Bud32
MRRLIAQGAESKLYLDGDKIVKERFTKKYRIKEIDEKLRKFRTKREAKILEKLALINFPSPRLIETDKKERITMENIKGVLLKDILDRDYRKLSAEIGEKIAVLHNNNLIHGDLTTSNMILTKNNKEVYFIDFGLSFFSHKAEDKAVDLHLLKEALESRHYKIWEKSLRRILEIYKKKAKNSDETIKRLEKVEKRGRYKGKKCTSS